MLQTLLYWTGTAGNLIALAVVGLVVGLVLFSMWRDRGTDYDPDDRDYNE